MWEYIIMAILQGLFEWLPISSEGQTMIIATNVFALSPGEAFSLAIFLHLGTMLAVLVKFRSDVVKIFKACLPNPPPEVTKTDIKMRNWIIIATIATAIIAIPLYFLVKDLFAATQGDILTLIIAGFLLITGIILLLTRKKYGKNTLNDVSTRSVTKHSIITGLVQGTSVLPGMSRSGVTVSVNLFENYEQNTALRLSFLMSIPVVLGVIVVDVLFGDYSVFGYLDPLTIVVVTVISFIVGYLTMEALLRLARKIQFGYFCIFFAVIAFAVVLPFLFL